MRFVSRILPIFGVLALLSACAMTARPGAMVADMTRDTIIADDHPLWKAIRLETVAGGHATGRPWSSSVNTEEFYQAVRDSLQLHAMLAPAAPRYRLMAEIVDVDEPWHGLNTTVTATVRYTLYDADSKMPLYRREIAHSYTTSFSDSALGQTRIRLAQEGAVKGTIQKFVRDLVAAANDKSGVFRTAQHAP